MYTRNNSIQNVRGLILLHAKRFLCQYFLTEKKTSCLKTNTHSLPVVLDLQNLYGSVYYSPRLQFSLRFSSKHLIIIYFTPIFGYIRISFFPAVHGFVGQFRIYKTRVHSPSGFYIIYT